MNNQQAVITQESLKTKARELLNKATNLSFFNRFIIESILESTKINDIELQNICAQLEQFISQQENSYGMYKQQMRKNLSVYKKQSNQTPENP